MAATIRSSSSSTATPTMPAGAASGDLIVVFAYRDGNATPPSLPANWTNITTASVNPSIRVAYRVYDGAWTMSAFTNAGRTHAFAIETGTYDETNVFGNTDTTGPTSNATITWPAFATDVDDDSSLVFRGVVKARVDSFTEPAGHTNHHEDGTRPMYATLTSNDSSEPASASSNNTGRTDAHTVVQVEILGATGGGTAIDTGLATETDTALNLGTAHGTNLASETDTALALTAVQVLATGVASETDTAQALGHVLAGATGVATETDAALNLALAQGLGVASETDTALNLGLAHGTGRADETDTAVALTVLGDFAAEPGIAEETDTALALSALVIAATGTATETDTALALSLAHGLGLAEETDTALALDAVVETEEEVEEEEPSGSHTGAYVVRQGMGRFWRQKELRELDELQQLQHERRLRIARQNNVIAQAVVACISTGMLNQ